MTRFPAAECPGVAGTPVAIPARVPLRTYHRPLAADAASAGEARSAVRRHLCDWDAAELVDDCSLIVTELVTNAVRHGGSPIHFRLGTNGSWVYGEVFDTGDRMPRVCDRGDGTDGEIGELDSPGGRGLLIVDRMADAWGVTRLPGGGKIVWFVLGGRGGLYLLRGA